MLIDSMSPRQAKLSATDTAPSTATHPSGSSILTLPARLGLMRLIAGLAGPESGFPLEVQRAVMAFSVTPRAMQAYLDEGAGLPESFIGRHPFPGPGLAIRVPGGITRQKLDILREADAVYLDEIRKAGLYDAIWQAFAVLLPVQTVGVMGDGRTYDFVCALRAVTSVDGMTADFYHFDMSFLGAAATRIINEVKGINRVVYDVTSKPPGTIEWE